MRFGTYTEIQCWSPAEPAQLYTETLEQVVNADRLGYDTYSVIEHYFWEKFSISVDPLSFFSAAAQRTERIVFRTLLHPLPLHNPTVLASRIAAADLILGGRYEFGVGRGHAWLPPKAGVPLDETQERYEEALDILFEALEHERFSHRGPFWTIEDGHIVPRPQRSFRVFVGGTSDATYERAAARGWGIVVPPLLPYQALEHQLGIYRTGCVEHGHEPNIVWIHAVHLDEDRDTALREAEEGMTRFLRAQAVASPELAPPEELRASGYGFYAAGILDDVAAMSYPDMVDGDYVWVGTPDEIAAKVQAVGEVCEGLSEVAIVANAGGAKHWKAIKSQELFAAQVMPYFREASESYARERERQR